MKFRAKNEHELSKLSDDDLVAYLVAARDAGQDGAARKAAGVLVWGRVPQLRDLIRRSVDDDGDVEDLVSTVMMQTIAARFDGHHTGQFFAVMHTIRKRRVADYLEKKHSTPRALGTADDGNNPWDLIPDDEDKIADFDSLAVLDQALSDYSERDRKVIEMKIDGYRAKEICEHPGVSAIDGAEALTPANVDQIFSRFRRLHLHHFAPDEAGDAL